ncbi:protein Skeletor: isoforms B/C-like protein [Leptotrombidium deliense]|uniref:Protein Skeletor: isoforms B/C-like protein n=1 Tax=Leptotrombidium deliense TaxID=299467 RepID=A0A443RS56_9ACAR|nr:protein Skeletor: isoforms B/C-like protein [Leptotrombidium deliense]
MIATADRGACPDTKVMELLENKTFDVHQAIGRYCEWKHASGVDQASKVSSVEEYKKTLKLVCDDGVPGTFHWMPDEHTPSVVYYQCFTHRNLGRKIFSCFPYDHSIKNSQLIEKNY